MQLVGKHDTVFVIYMILFFCVVVTAMKVLIEPSNQNVDRGILCDLPTGKMLAGVLHVKQEFFRPFFDEIDYRVKLLENVSDYYSQT